MGKYTVKKGDNLSSIAKKNGLTLNQLLKLNPLIKDSSLIGVGDIITLREQTSKPREVDNYRFLEKSTSKVPTDETTSWNREKKLNYEREQMMSRELNKSKEAVKKGSEQGKLDKAKLIKRQTKQMKGKSPTYLITTKKLEALRKYGYKGEIDGIWGKGSEAALAKALAEGYDFDDNGNLVKQSSAIQTNDKYLDNLWPYGYTDNPYDDSTPEWKMKLGTAEKILKGLSKNPDRVLADEFASLDLSTPEGIKRANEIRQTDRFKRQWPNANINYILQSLRARLDANDLYYGRPLTYNTWMENPDYLSPSAKAAGVPTYTYADPKVRKRMQQKASSFGKEKGVGVHPVVGDELLTFNNYTINTMHNDGSGRYVDKWDFFVDLPGSKEVFIGDTIPPGLTPVYHGIKLSNNNKE